MTVLITVLAILFPATSSSPGRYHAITVVAEIVSYVVGRTAGYISGEWAYGFPKSKSHFQNDCQPQKHT